jgi:hypothetical protein
MPTTKEYKYKGHPLVFAGGKKDSKRNERGPLKHGEYIAVDNSVLSKHTLIGHKHSS